MYPTLRNYPNHQNAEQIKHLQKHSWGRRNFVKKTQ